MTEKVNLYRYEIHPDKYEEIKQKVESVSDTLLDYGITDTEFSEEIKKIFREFGLPEDTGLEDLRERIKFDSGKYPRHPFKVGFWFSENHTLGLEHVLRNTIEASLYEIFPGSGEVSHNPVKNIKVNWKECENKINNIIPKFQSFIDVLGEYDAIPFSHENLDDSEIKNPRDALKHFIQNKNNKVDYVTRDRFQMYFPEDTTVKGLIEGSDFNPLKSNPCVYAIIERQDKSHYNWYLKGLKIIQETCEWVLDQESPENYQLEWKDA